ncbi:MAG: DNA translocase FtsK [Chlorobiaceae bacterium]|nr:DNA translocase FtsK [Chlorobiaceae bacterium]NTW74315.1 DNA translocase FtsK [Chlorobiaceae bacterium]
MSGLKALRKESLVREAGGIALMLLSLFLAAAVLAYHPLDEAVITTLPWHEVFSDAAKAVASTIHNPFGLFGARVAVFFIRVMFGYPSVIPFVALLVAGWQLLRLNPLRPALLFMIYALLITLDISTLFGLATASFSDVMAGSTGRMLASFLSTVIGMAGAWALVSATGIALTFLMGRQVISRTVSVSSAFFLKLSRSIAAIRAEKARRKVEKAAMKVERRAAMEAKALEKKQKPVSPVPPAPAVMESVQESAVGVVPSSPPPFEPLPEEPEPLAASVPPVVDADGPEMIIRAGVHEQEADLDARSLKVRTRNRVPYRFPSIDLLQKPRDDDDRYDERHLAESKNRLLEKLSIYKIDVVKIETTVGPRVTLFELELAPDVKISRVKTLENDLAMALAARGIRIIAPIPGKNAVGVEIPNSKPKTVMMRSVLQVEKFKNSTMALPIALGKTISNEVLIEDLATMPHLLIAGATGAGKSVAINVILTSLLYARRPDEVKFVLVDPKRVELSQYQKLKDHFLPKIEGLDDQIIVTDPKKAPKALQSVVREMERRYETLEKSGVRNIREYNRKMPEEAMFYLVVVIDELADLMITAGREVEEPITRLAQMARAVGIHLIVATQRPSVDIITGIIKANFPSRIAFQVASKVDSRTILDVSGADQLLGNGDMLFQSARMPKPDRIQCPYVSSEEVDLITTFIGSQPAQNDDYVLPEGGPSNGSSSGSGQDREGRDSMFEEAARMVVMHQQASVSLLQRRLRLGFSRAGRVMDQLHDCGIVSAGDGSKPREVLIRDEDSLELLLRNLD